MKAESNKRGQAFILKLDSEAMGMATVLKEVIAQPSLYTPEMLLYGGSSLEGLSHAVIVMELWREKRLERKNQNVYSVITIYFEGQGENTAVVKALEYVFIFLEEVL